MKISSVMKPNLWALLKLLKDEESLTTYKFANALRLHPAKDDKPGRTGKRLARAETLQKIVLTWDIISTKTYITALSSHFNSDEQ
jgi:hypothetical protein